MASAKACTAALLLLLAVAIAAATADAAKSLASEPARRLRPAEEDAAATTCVSSLLALSPCLPFFKDAGTDAAPEGCCAGLRGIIDDQAVCLCHIVNHTLERAIGVDIPVDGAFTLVGDLCGLALPQDVLAGCANEGAVPPLYACPAPLA